MQTHTCTKSHVENTSLAVLVIEPVHVVEVHDHGHAVHLPVPEDQVAKHGTFQLRKQEGKKKLTQLETGQIKREPPESSNEEKLMEEYTEDESDHECLEYCRLMSQQILQVKVSVEVFMDHSVPLSVVLIKSTGVPEVLIELTVRKFVQICIEIRSEIEDHEKADHESDENRLIPACKELERVHALIPEADIGEAY